MVHRPSAPAGGWHTAGGPAQPRVEVRGTGLRVRALTALTASAVDGPPTVRPGRWLAYRRGTGSAQGRGPGDRPPRSGSDRLDRLRGRWSTDRPPRQVAGIPPGDRLSPGSRSGGPASAFGL